MCMGKSKTSLTLSSGNYQKLKVLKITQVVFDITVLFTERYVNYLSRTRDQMVQAARSTCQNIVEGNIAIVTSTRSGLHRLNIARGSLAELKCDYEDFLRQNNLPFWEANNPLRLDFIRRRVATNAEFYDFNPCTREFVSR